MRNEKGIDMKVIDTEIAGLPPMPHWKDALKEFMELEFGSRVGARVAGR